MLEDFYRIGGTRLLDRNAAPLRDDYLRFIRWSVWKLLEQEGAPGHGVLAFVTNRAFLERKLHRTVRHFLLRKFDEIHAFDLHGDQREWFADRVDEKVFKEVQAGIALTVFVKRPAADEADSPATVRYRDEFGRREAKYEACRNAELGDAGWQTLAPAAPLWLFVPYDVELEYETWPSVTGLFPLNVVGFQTHRDQLVVAFSEDELRERFANAAVPDGEWQAQKIRSIRIGISRLTAVHLLEDPGLADSAPAVDGDDLAVLEAPVHDPIANDVRLASNLVVRDVTAEMWTYQQGAYRVLRDFMTARVGRRLSSEEFHEFRLLAEAVRTTLELLPQIDALIAPIAASALPAEALLGTGTA